MARKRSKSARKSRKTQDAPPPADASESNDGQGQRRFLRYGFVLVLTGGVILMWLSLLTWHPADPPSPSVYPPVRPVHNAAGIVGAHLAYFLRYWLGGGAYVGLIFASIAAAVLITGRRISDVPWRLLGVAMLIVATSAGIYLASPAETRNGLDGTAGIVGASLGDFLHVRFGSLGSWVVLSVTTLIAALLAADEWLVRLPGAMKKLWQRRHEWARRLADRRAEKQAQREAMSTPAPAPAAVQPAPRPAAGKNDDKKSSGKDDGKGKQLSLLSKKIFGGKKDDAPRQPAGRAGEPAPPPQPEDSPYQLPSDDLLADPVGGYIESQEAQAAEKGRILQSTLDNFGVNAEVVGHQTGPVITMFELRLAPGVKVSHITGLATDMGRALAVPGVRVVSPIPGKDTVGIEVPNLEKETVRIKELMKLAPDAARSMHLPTFLGKDAGGDPIVADLATMPHMLIAGTTGSGKSVSINSIIVSLLMTRRPEEVKFILADPKMVEMAAFEKIPHLLCPIVNDMRKAEDILEWAVTKMDERYALLRDAGVRNIATYNRLSKKELYDRLGVSDPEEKKRVKTRLPYWVIIIDELADLMMTSSKEVEGYIIRIAQKARAVGIHLVLATQRPSADVVTGLIKSNIPCRVSFRVASRQESRIVLDQNGADVLLGQGDMLFLQPGTSNLVRAQGAFVDDREIHKVVKELTKYGEPKFNQELVKLQSKAPGDISGERDEMFDKAVQIVLQAQRGSVSLLQRRLQVGYGRASRIIDQMAEAGILGEHKGSQARECQMTLEDWQALQESIAADQSGASSLNGEPTSA